MEVVDGKTRIRLSLHYKEDRLFDDWKKAELVDTNIFEKKRNPK